MLSQRLKSARNRSKLTQEALAEKVNTTKSTISNYENGHSTPSNEMLVLLSKVLNVPTDYLLGVTVFGYRLGNARRDKKMIAADVAKKINIPVELYKKYEQDILVPDDITINKLLTVLDVSADYLFGKTNQKNLDSTVTVAGKEISLSIQELQLFNELKKHPIMFHDLASDPEAKVKELIKLYKMKKMFLEEDEVEHGDGFGELED